MVVQIPMAIQVEIGVQLNCLVMATTFLVLVIGNTVMKVAQYMSVIMIGNFQTFLNFILSFLLVLVVLQQHQQVFHMKIVP